MSAKDHVQPHQLQMFMTGEELVSYARPADLTSGPGDNSDELTWDNPNKGWGEKLREARRPEGRGHGAGVYDSVEKHGVREPVAVVHSFSTTGDRALADGHHRVAVAADIERKTAYSDKPRTMYVPVEHWEH